MSTIRLFSLLFLFLNPTNAAALIQNRQNPKGISLSTDNTSIIFDSSVQLDGVPLRFKISAPASQFTSLTNVPGAASLPNNPGPLGVNVLLHGDGGQSFFDFPNQKVKNHLGVVLLAPSTNSLWGQRTGQASGLSRPDGIDDAELVRDFVKEVLPQLVAFNSKDVFFTGVSGGALLLSGFFMPAHLQEFDGAGVLLLCGGMPPQVEAVEGFEGNTRIHYQSTTNELELLKDSIPEAIRAYEGLALAGGLSEEKVGRLQTADNSLEGGHCEFDGEGFVSGIQFLVDNFEDIMLEGGDGRVNGVNVLTSVVENEELRFV
ncbi:hypothetical protein QBC38DRAFT_69183 [Podospora fimiseda]|uniref:Uncharacterized protein n=1 Tax=Podospora fimiseda TaxID=252190 RepID=A0AAN7BUK6_9PEZI|nr:hypothetical protein QBC38DRAFT_69183 [Podospora fimiseda]